MSPERRDNVFQPLDDERDSGCHGDFDARASDRSYQVLASRYKGWLALLGLGAVGVLAALTRRADGHAALDRRPNESTDIHYSEQLARSPAQEGL